MSSCWSRIVCFTARVSTRKTSHELPQRCLPFHWISFLEEGGYEIRYGRCGEERRVVGKGEVLIIPSGCIHAVRSVDSKRQVVVKWGHFMMDLACEVPVFVPRRLCSNLEHALSGVIEHFPMRDRQKHFYQYEKGLYELGSELVDVCGEKKLVKDPHVSLACEFLEAGLGEAWDRVGLASAVGISVSALARRFQEVKGRSPMRYLNDLRMQKASELLGGGGGYSISEVGNEVGFEDSYHFSRSFKRYFGCSPKVYRQRVMEGFF